MCKVIFASNCQQTIKLITNTATDLVLIDTDLFEIDNCEFIKQIKKLDSDIEVIVMSGAASSEKTMALLRMGAYDFISKPIVTEEILSTIKRYTDRINLKSEVNFLRNELQIELGYEAMISINPLMKEVFTLVSKVSRTSSNVLVRGESGTGKELVARALHASSERSERPFVAVHCGALLHGGLVESELFGHEKGAFTGAHVRKIGKFEYAHEGTFFLDEVSTLPLDLQAKLLRVIQEQSFIRVGGVTEVEVDIRIIAATNANLEEMVENGSFREDLYYRLNVVPITLPPLRERMEDIPILVEYFLGKYCAKNNKHIEDITNKAIDAFYKYSWPGNVRELENIIERLVVFSKDNCEITRADLPLEILHANEQFAMRSLYEIKDFKEAVKAFERQYIIKVLESKGWSRKKTAEFMKIHRNTLLMKMKELGVEEGICSEQTPMLRKFRN